MILARWLVTLLVLHFLGALIVGISAMGFPAGIPAGILFALLGCFYLLIEAPVVFLGQFLMDKVSSKFAVVVIGIGLSALGAVIGYLLCFTEGGGRPYEYARGYSIAGSLMGILVLVSVLMFPRQSLAK